MNGLMHETGPNNIHWIFLLCFSLYVQFFYFWKMHNFKASFCGVGKVEWKLASKYVKFSMYKMWTKWVMMLKKLNSVSQNS